jgi:gliding motility-associated protein GldM
MSGAKETPRQKMIGMMYLVLTALLALQVSSSVMYKFKFLEDQMDLVVSETHERNVATVANIVAKVEERGNKDTEKKILEDSKHVRATTTKLLEYIEGLKDELEVESGGVDEHGFYLGAKVEDIVQVKFIGPNKKGKGYELRDKLNEYVVFLESMALNPKDYPPFALDGAHDPLFKHIPEQREKDFAQLTFENTPMVAAMAVLSEMESRIVQMESEILSELAAEVGAADFKFDVTQAMVRPQSKIVAAGANYEAEMFIAAFSSAIKPHMTFAGKEIPVEGGIGKIKFKATPGTYDKEGLAKKIWKGEITLPKPTGGDTTFVVEEEYFVARPVIQIQSASVQALYRNCGNELDVQVPALGTTYNPTFKATGAQTISGSKKGIVTVVPKARKVKLTVYSNGDYIGDQEFKVRGVPLPVLVAISNKRPVNIKDGVAVPGPRKIDVQAQPDKDFAAFLPKDARYRAVEVDVTLARGKRAIKRQTFKSQKLSLTSFAALAKPGDRYVIEVKRVVRRNFQNRSENVDIPVTSRIITIPLN